ncbi:prefoldin [Trypanosoma cruzi]|uniref:Prefoldin subunit 3 n=1 Tax=Trypanosoma cruzi TaxID=5693 RepID=A0A2V2VU17_TRYCR|nr:putative prefoldin [Trypanosoma cruzi]PBJ77420.1 prefoldin [Trypanosoma cruzi cruzi]PWU99851.1 putative prefoldin [Trypanosoma cruzi]RNF17273.1 prefoldin [Trypanosoma cruzi]
MTAMERYAFAEDYKNARGIPRVEYISDMATFVKNNGGADALISKLILDSSKYEHTEKRLVSSMANLDHKIPTIKKTLHALNFLKKRLQEDQTPVRSYYCLTDAVFGEAEVVPQETVHLWMGAKVMVEYTFDEALQLLEKNLANAETNLKATKEDLAWVQEQMTNLQINISRVYNYDLKNKRTNGAAAEPSA